MNPKLELLFAEYEKAFASLDIKRNAALYADTFLSAGPQGVIAQSKEEFIRLADQAAAFYKSVGQKAGKIISMRETPISNEYTMVTVHWGAQFEKTGDRWIEFDVSYFVQLNLPEPRIIMFIAHEDEAAAMKELGLMDT
jgi:hypothetical protein